MDILSVPAVKNISKWGKIQLFKVYLNLRFNWVSGGDLREYISITLNKP